MSEIILGLGTQRTEDGLNSCDASEYGSDALDADTELAEDESWYKEAYGIFNKRKFGLGAVPENGDRVTKFYNKGAYDGSVTKMLSRGREVSAGRADAADEAVGDQF
ncbi:hypothetical protein JL720_13938 [Aureococcus anophagefferens]|nr:hypothetical protein JL720_13938 [Aureococcus anophagefferens]